VKGVKQ